MNNVIKYEYNIGIVVPCANIPDHIKYRFKFQLEKVKQPITYIVEFIEDDCYTNGYFNLSKSRNNGIRKLKDMSEVIVCCDVDIMIPSGLLEFTYRKCLQMNGLVFSYTRFVEESVWNNSNDNDLLRIPSASSGLGGWNAMLTHEWINIGGWNEDLYGWGYEDQEFHSRIRQNKIPSVSTNSFPLVHINHPRRSSTHIDTHQRNIKLANDSFNKNWL